MKKIQVKSSEAEQQKQIIRWCNTMCDYPKYNELALIYHCPNGGQRNQKEAYHLKLEGVKAGVPDLFLPVARGGYFGLYIELKWDNNKTTALQDWWLKSLSKQGYLCYVCYGFEEAREIIEKYIELPKTAVKKD